MPSVVFDASSLVGALLKAGSVPERALLLARTHDCRDAKDRKYLALALAAAAEVIVSSDDDLLVLNPWRGIAIITPAEYADRLESIHAPPATATP